MYTHYYVGGGGGGGGGGGPFPIEWTPMLVMVVLSNRTKNKWNVLYENGSCGFYFIT